MTETATIHGVEIRKTFRATFRKVGEPESGTRPECWKAETVDGLWIMERLELEGSPWQVLFAPLQLDMGMFASLDAVCNWINSDRAAPVVVARSAAAVEHVKDLIVKNRAVGRTDFEGFIEDELPAWARHRALALLDGV